jgi:hypothetical protein
MAAKSYDPLLQIKIVVQPNMAKISLHLTGIRPVSHPTE